MFSFRRGKEPFQLSIYTNSSYIRHKPGDFQVWKDYPHYASKPGGLKKGFDKLASRICLHDTEASLAFLSFFHMLPIIPPWRKLKKHQALVCKISIWKNEEKKKVYQDGKFKSSLSQQERWQQKKNYIFISHQKIRHPMVDVGLTQVAIL